MLCLQAQVSGVRLFPWMESAAMRVCFMSDTIKIRGGDAMPVMIKGMPLAGRARPLALGQ